MVKKVTVSIPDDLLGEIDAEAAALATSRSGIVQEAAAHYLAHTREERSAAQRQALAEDTLDWLRQLAARPPLDPRPSLEILREVRGESEGEPGAD